MKNFLRWACVCLMLTGMAWAEDAPEAPVTAYINLMPALVGNYAPGSKLKFYKADIALRVNSANKAKVEYHIPLIRDQLVLLFVQQSEENFATVESKEMVRKAALERIQQALQQEEGQPLVEDILFNNLVLQR